MRLFGLIGWPLDHSFSKRYFSEKFRLEGIQDARYELFPLENISELPALLAEYPDLCGLNVTIPHKEAVLPLLHELDDTAQTVAAVNCIRILPNRYLVGYNTDVIGFEQSLMQWFDALGISHPYSPLQALILGTGGASKAVAFVLRKYNIPFQWVSRRPDGENEISYESLHTADLALNQSVRTLIINTTPLGTAPNVDTKPPLPTTLLRHETLVYDLVYNPAETLLLRDAKSRGCATRNGMDMLTLQAEAAWEIWRV